MKRKVRKSILFLALALMLTLCAGCMQANIKEDEIRDDLVSLDPQAGVEKEITFVCYSQLLDEPYLVGVSQSVMLGGGERAERVMTEAVINAATAVSGEESRLFPKGTEIVDLSMDGSVLYLTLSKHFFDDSELKREEERLKRDLDGGQYTQQEYDERIQEMRERFYKLRELAVYALTNTISGYSENTRLLILIDLEGKGTGVRLPRSSFFPQDNSSALIEPLMFEESIVVTPERMADIFLKHLKSGEYGAMYALLASSRDGNAVDYSRFEAELRSFGTLKSYQINGMSLQGSDMQQVNVSITVANHDGQDVFLENVRLNLRNENGIFKPDYESLKQIMEEL